MKSTCDPERASNAEIPRDRMQARICVEVVILTGVENVEASYPECDGGGEQKDTRVQRTADRNPGSGGCDAEGKSQHKVRPAGYTLRVGVEQQHRQRHWRQQQRQPIELACGKYE